MSDKKKGQTKGLKKDGEVPTTIWKCELDFKVDDLPDLAPAASKGKAPSQVSDVVPLDQMTVGRKFLLRCQGEPVFLKRDKLAVLAPTKKPFSLVLLEVRRLDEKSGDFLMSSYQPGKHQIAGVHFSDGEQIVAIEKFELNVASVVQASKGKPPKPFGPYGPFTLTWPVELWIALGILAFALLGSAIFAIWKSVKRRRLISGLKQYDTALKPFDQFNKEIRKLKREIHYAAENERQDEVSQVDRSLRLYLVREFAIPALEWNETLIFKELKGRCRAVFDGCRNDLRITFHEISKATDTKKLSTQDIQLLVALSQKTVSHLWRENTRSRKSKGNFKASSAGVLP